MGATYTRQSSYSDGDVITAAHTNDEFNQLLAAFAASSGHTHDGTAAEGGPITKLLGTSLTFGDGTAGTDITVTFDGETNDGVLKWMEDEDYFEFSDDILVASTEKLQFRDTAIYINSSTDGQLDLVADTEIQIAATTVDLNGNLDVSGSITLGGTAITSTATELNVMDGGTSATSTTLADADRVVVNDAGTMKQVALTDFETYFESALDTLSNVTTVGALNSGSITSGFGTIDTGSSTITTTGLITGGSLDIDDVLINGSNIGHTDDTDLITVANGLVTVAGEISVTTQDIGGTNVAATATELNIMDGDTSATSTTLADADRVVVNYAGTMKQVALTDFETYFESALDTLSNVTTVGVLNSGSITSGFGAIDNGSSAITTTGTITYGSLSDGSITITAFVDEDNMASNSATLVPTQQSVKAYVDTQLTAEDLDITTDSGTIDIDLDSETLTIAGGSGLSSSASSSTVTMAIDAAQTGITSVVNSSLELGRDADNRIKFGTDNQIIFEVDGGDNVIFKTSGEIAATSLDVSGDIDVDGTTNLDNTDIDGTLVVDGSNISLDSTSTLNIDNSNTSNGITIGTATSGVPISIGHSTSEVTVNDNLPVTGDLTVSGTTTTVNSTTVNLNDHNIVLDSGNSTSAVINGAGITLEGGTGTDATFAYSTSGPKFEIKLGSDYEDLQVDQLIAASLDISGDIDVDGTANLDVVDIDGAVDMASTLTVAGVVDITDTTDSSDATGDTGALRTEGGASIAKKLFVGTDLDVDGTANLDNTDIDGTLAVDGATISLDATTSLNIDNSNTSNGITIGTATSGVPVSIGHTTSEVTVNDNMTVTGTMTQTGVSTSTAKDVFNAGMSVKNGSTSAGFVEFFEDSDNGTNKVTLIGPASTSDITLTLPSTAGTVATTASAEDTSIALAIALG